jgi:hypothetical protein
MSPTTFHEIEIAKGVAPSKMQECSPLSDWYARIRDVPLSSFGVGDLSKSVRQCLFPDYVIPVALQVLEKEPLAGEMYDGELASAFHAISETFWYEHREIAARALSVMKGALPQIGDADVQGVVSATAARIESAMRRP